MPSDDRSRCHQNERLFPPRPRPSQRNQEQLLWGGEPSPRSFRLESEQLLTQGEIFKDEILSGTERTNNPAKQVPEPHNHGKNLNEMSPTEPTPKSLKLRAHDVLMNHRGTGVI